MKVVIDRIEGDLAVVEVAGKFVEWPVAALPAGAREGSILEVTITLVPAPPPPPPKGGGGDIVL
jgi:hypothetical protein